MKQIDQWHRDKGWLGCGYHYVIEEDGRIIVPPSREIPFVGAHAKGVNKDSIGICVVGDNFDLHNSWNADQRESLGRLIGALRIVFPHALVMGHKDSGTTTVTLCPGTDEIPGVRSPQR